MTRTMMMTMTMMMMMMTTVGNNMTYGFFSFPNTWSHVRSTALTMYEALACILSMMALDIRTNRLVNPSQSGARLGGRSAGESSFRRSACGTNKRS